MVFSIKIDKVSVNEFVPDHLMANVPQSGVENKSIKNSKCLSPQTKRIMSKNSKKLSTVLLANKVIHSSITGQGSTTLIRSATPHLQL